MRGHVRQRAGGQAWRDRQPIAHVSVTSTRHGSVDGEDDRVVPAIAGALDEIAGVPPICHEVELKPMAQVGRHGGEVLDGCGAERGQAVRNSHAFGHGGDRRLARVVHHPREPRGPKDQRERRGFAQNHGAGVHGGDVLQNTWLELHPREGATGPVQAGLILSGSSIGVVKDGTWHSPTRQGAHILNTCTTFQQGGCAIPSQRLTTDQRAHLTPPGDTPLHVRDPSR